jgi:hypothetical protein
MMETSQVDQVSATMITLEGQDKEAQEIITTLEEVVSIKIVDAAREEVEVEATSTLATEQVLGQEAGMTEVSKSSRMMVCGTRISKVGETQAMLARTVNVTEETMSHTRQVATRLPSPTKAAVETQITQPTSTTLLQRTTTSTNGRTELIFLILMFDRVG